jgi:hypothetical protein
MIGARWRCSLVSRTECMKLGKGLCSTAKYSLVGIAFQKKAK